jgi:hypothetical protein
MLREMRIKDVCFVNCDFALFISIYFIIVIINMIGDNQIYMISLDCTRVRPSEAFREVRHAEDRVPGAEDKVPGAEDKAPGAEDKVPGAENNVPGAEDKVPGAEDNVPGAEDNVPGAEAGA